ncbi:MULTISPECIES: hypothetical protein [Moorena]|uniref:Uncharacterized protein n=1 Tax=Moorena producens 3L TaxID=489825 RepID=F4XRU6_9CYAN|nr:MULTISPECIES: hypothetical protein [Moorena]NEQ15500.1 hypothetical protein [Moorena sp. SIO3E2]EGJ32665.1 hypothetical protein LYNGBM3L_04860 [Moorena producens 3L]NEP65172.1 hypothetical protein [Moorena sp. SIO3A5]NER87848.1 hypothetical protein [Moorena sp. SIO3A2]NES41550.1 hypothetical protein [Moorena sp. SIO2C4]
MGRWGDHLPVPDSLFHPGSSLRASVGIAHLIDPGTDQRASESNAHPTTIPLTVPYSLLPIPDSRFPIPDSLFPY